MRIVLPALSIIALLLATGAPTSAASGTSFISVANTTKDASAWVTVYGDTGFGTEKIWGAWCVEPGAKDSHGLHAYIDSVRVEVKTGAGCGRNAPLKLDTRLSTKGGKNNGPNLVHFFAEVRGSDGRYSFKVIPY